MYIPIPINIINIVDKNIVIVTTFFNPYFLTGELRIFYFYFTRTSFSEIIVLSSIVRLH